ncbi:MAG: NAD-dependent epimerase/dehydratase family protein [Proteobacteria bacterium]|nr:NAD-dependent epimerase/dehydratase family protein [Pseudomonadota bacterium]
MVGGAGFIGSHFAEHLLDAGHAVTVYDNFSSGTEGHIAACRAHPHFAVVAADVHDRDRLEGAMRGHDTVIHLASNPDIAKAMTDPDVDFREGTELTRNVAEAMRRGGVRRILYASGSGIYGDLGDFEVSEDHGPLVPVSPYGASKAYAHMFGLRARVFRFGNVVGGRQTHGVGYDFLRRLLTDATRLTILGDGRQSKSYVHVLDVIAAVMLAHRDGGTPWRAYNVCTGDYITVTEIAGIVCEVLGVNPEYAYTGGDRGWKGDVPVMRLDTQRIRALGWRCERTSAEAIRTSVRAMRAELEPAPS